MTTPSLNLADWANVARPPSTWLVFAVGRYTYTIELSDVAEVLAARALHLVPLIAREIGGVLNVRGEPLPVVDGGAVLQTRSTGSTRHVLVFENDDRRMGLLVDYVLRIDRDFSPDRLDAHEAPDDDGGCISMWRRSPQGGALGIVDTDSLLARAANLLCGENLESREEPCQNAF